MYRQLLKNINIYLKCKLHLLCLQRLHPKHLSSEQPVKSAILLYSVQCELQGDSPDEKYPSFN